MISLKLIGWRTLSAAALLTLAACGQPVATDDSNDDAVVSDESGERGEGGDDRTDDSGGEGGESGEGGEGGNRGPG